jgi:hypothetical protein
MAGFLAAGFVLLGILGIVVYNGTPHGGPTAVCSPISAFGQVTSVPFDCRYFSTGEIIFIVVCFILALISAVSMRPGRDRQPR